MFRGLANTLQVAASLRPWAWGARKSPEYGPSTLPKEHTCRWCQNNVLEIVGEGETVKL